MTRTCPRCSHPNIAEAVFCSNCASPLSSAATVGAPEVKVDPKALATPGASQRAVIALLLAVLALLCCGPLAGVPAAIVGWMELEAIKNGRSSPDGKWMATAGLWGGIASAALHIFGYFIWFALGMMSNPYY